MTGEARINQRWADCPVCLDHLRTDQPNVFRATRDMCVQNHMKTSEALAVYFAGWHQKHVERSCR